ncbi:MAG: glutamine--fructose-6-phosphate transaminase (isomerizing), partial [Nitrosomonas sp.]
MCGIFGYVGNQDAVAVTLTGLKKLEYRGYDSAGIAGFNPITGELECSKVVGKISRLEEEVKRSNLCLKTTIAQTRWATHGKPNEINAHPHFDTKGSLALVHNGIIENHDSLRKMLQAKGCIFKSETDTEVVAQLIGNLYEGDLLTAIQRTLPLLHGAYALVMIHQDYPNQIFAVASAAPLAVGMGDHEAFVSSDVMALKSVAKEVLHLANNEVAVVHADQIETFDATMAKIVKDREAVSGVVDEISKGDFEHYTIKEIFEQPKTLSAAIASRFSEEYGTATLDGLNMDVTELLNVQRILILACGTSWHAGFIGAYMLEDLARIPVQVEISSEYRYKNPIVLPGTYVIAMSQSGETADTIAAVEELKAKGAKVLSLCNVHGSTLTRLSDGCLYLRAGPEIGVCSTKAFTSQVAVLFLFTLLMARMRHMGKAEGQALLQALLPLPDQVQQVLEEANKIEQLAKNYSHYNNFFFLGRRHMYPAALEGALKL